MCSSYRDLCLCFLCGTCTEDRMEIREVASQFPLLVSQIRDTTRVTLK